MLNQQYLNEIPSEIESINIQDLVYYILELLSIKALEKNNELSVVFENGFPEEVRGEVKKFKMVTNSQFTQSFISFRL
jgi:hypothetical protein